MTNRFTILLLVFVIFGCNNMTEKSDLVIYNQNSTELIRQILVNKEMDCSCFLETEHLSLLEIMSYSTPSSDNRKILKKALKITNDSIFDKQNELSKEFRIFKLNLNFDITLLNLSQLASIRINSGNQKYSETLWEKCPSGMLTLSPPVFNETYDIAVIEVSNCISGGTLGIYNLINGKWEYITHIYVSLS